MIFLTASHAQTFADECMASGARLVMTKPLNPGLLLHPTEAALKIFNKNNILR